MTVLPAPSPRQAISGRVRKPMRAISVSKAMGARIAAAAQARGWTMGDIVIGACADILEPAPAP